MSIDKDQISTYLNKTKFIILATVNKEQSPVQRTLGSFAVDGLTAYFSTHKSTAKVEQIEANPKVSIVFQHESQELSSFINVSLTGKANKLEEKEDIDKAIQLIGNRNPRFKERAGRDELNDNVFFQVNPQEIKVLDFSKGAGPQAIQLSQFGAIE